jgi:hypothetical protein
VDTDDPIVEVLRYVVDEQPEGTDWSAWPAQRLGDDQTTLLRRLN